MQPERIQELLQKDIKKIARAADAVAPHFRTEDIHQFRVGVKKLRAFIHFINSVKGQPHLKLNRNFKRLYSIAGTLRDAHLKYETLTGRSLLLPHYYDNLSLIVNRNKAEWEKLYSKKIMKKLSVRVTEHEFNAVRPTDLARFFEKKIAKINKINNGHPDDEHIHKMRKLIKDMVYITSFAEKKWENAHAVIARIPHQQLIDISNLIGNYNDGSILLRELSSFSSMGMQPDEEAAMACYANDSLARHQLLQKDLLKQIAAFVNVAQQ